jgi:hypothetical protein
VEIAAQGGPQSWTMPVLRILCASMKIGSWSASSTCPMAMRPRNNEYTLAIVHVKEIL